MDRAVKASRLAKDVNLLRNTLMCQKRYLATTQNISLYHRRNHHIVLSSRGCRKDGEQLSHWLSHRYRYTVPAIITRLCSSKGSLPEHTIVGMPNLSPTMETGTVISWLKNEGDKIEEGDALAEIETDKSTMMLDASYEGYLARVLIPAGTKDIPVGQSLYVLVENEGDVAAFHDFSPENKEVASAPTTSTESPNTQEISSSFSQDYPEHTLVGMPNLSPTMETGTVITWLKNEGERVEEGDALAEIETDKSTMVLDSSYDGYLAKILLPAGTKDIPINKPLFVIVENESDLPAFKSYTPPATDRAQPHAKAEPKETTHPATSTPATHSAPAAAPSTGRVFASPLVRRLAAEKGFDLSSIGGSGPGGRIVAKDLSSAQQKAPSAGPSVAVSTTEYTDIDLSNMRKTIAKRLTESKQTVPHYYLTVDVTMDAIIELRKELNNSLANTKLSVNDFIIKAAALSCMKVPAANSAWMDSYIREYHSVDMCVAVATDKGLITPIVKGADKKGLATINSEVVSLAAKAREGKLQPHEFQGGTFTISNLGMFGVKHFTAIINPPQVCILACGGAEQKLIPDNSCREGYRTASVMMVTLSCDHRVVDGAVGAQWLAEFRQFMEQPSRMML